MSAMHISYSASGHRGSAATGPASIVVAEIGANHDGSADKAHQMLDAVAATGGKLVKFQLYTADELVSNKSAPVRWGPPGLEREETVGEMFERVTLDRAAYPELFSHARERGLTPFATPFSENGVDFLEGLGNPIYKIASSDVTHLALLRHIARTGRPVVLSLGKSTLAEAAEAVETLGEAGCSDLTLLHCVAAYPTPVDEANLRTIGLLQAVFAGCRIGFSDHTRGIAVALAAVALGAEMIEKHVTLDTSADGPDHWFSISMDQLAALVEGAAEVRAALGSPTKQITPSERDGRQHATRSLVAACAIRAGAIVRPDDIKILRPGTGISPKYATAVAGLTARIDIPAETPLQWQMFHSSPTDVVTRDQEIPHG